MKNLPTGTWRQASVRTSFFRIATGGHFEWRFLGVAVIVAVPFAVISELVVDHPDFWKNILPTKWFTADGGRRGF